MTSWNLKPQFEIHAILINVSLGFQWYGVVKEVYVCVFSKTVKFGSTYHFYWLITFLLLNDMWWKDNIERKTQFFNSIHPALDFKWN